MKRVVSVILAVTLLLLSVPSLCCSEILSKLDFAFLSLKVSAEGDEGLYDDFTCTFDEQTGIYTVDGTSSIPDFSEYVTAPWFDYADKIKSLIITDGITGIGNSAFGSLPAVETVTIGKNVAYIEDVAFGLCTSLVSITVDADNAEFSSVDGVLFNKDQTVLIVYPAGLKGDYTVPDTVTAIAPYAFFGCYNLDDVYMGVNVSTIGEFAFGICSNLAIAVYLEKDIPDEFEGLDAVYLDGDNTVISSAAFYMCSNLQTVELKSVSYIDDSAFLFCSTSYFCLMSGLPVPENPAGIKSLYISGNDVKIGAAAFSYCLELNDVTLNGVVSIGTEAFAYCIAIDSLDLSSVTDIAARAFSGCAANYFNAMVGETVFEESGLKSVVFNAESTIIGDDAFSYCLLLKDVDFTGVTAIYPRAFMLCVSLESVELNGIGYIGENAFFACDNNYFAEVMDDDLPDEHTGLTSVVVSGDDVSIGENAFANCALLSSVKFSDVSFIYSNAFENTAFYLEKSSVPGYAIYYDNILLKVDSMCETAEFVIKDGTENVAYDAFSDCYGIESVVLPLSVKFFGYSYYTGIIKVSCQSEILSKLQDDYRQNVVKTHDSEKTVELPATCTEPGTQSCKCKICDEVYNETIPALGHDYSDNTYDATCFERGYTVYFCNRCGDIHIGGYTESEKNHSFVGGVCKDCGVCEADCVESLHNYPNAPLGETLSETQIVSKPGADALIIKFSALTSVEEYGDCIIVSSEDGTYCQTFTGNELASKDVTVPGDTAKITLEYNDSNSDYGFAVIKVTPCYFGLNLVNSSVEMLVSYDVIESDHNYENNEDKTWIITKNGAQSIVLHFSPETRTETNYDYIYIYDKFGVLIGKYSGTSLADETIEVNGDCAQIRLTSDYSSSYYGFAVTSVSAKYTKNEIDHVKKLIVTDVQGCTDTDDMLICSDGIKAVAKSGASGFIGTGSTVSITVNDISLGDYTVVINGDIDGDSICDVLDVVLVERALNGHGNLNDLQFRASGAVDDAVSVTDFQHIVNKALA